MGLGRLRFFQGGDTAAGLKNLCQVFVTQYFSTYVLYSGSANAWRAQLMAHSSRLDVNTNLALSGSECRM